MPDGLFQHDPRLLGKSGRGKEAADIAINGSRRCEIGNERLAGRYALSQHPVALALAKVHTQVAQALPEAFECSLIDFIGWNARPQRLFYTRLVRRRVGALAR